MKAAAEVLGRRDVAVMASELVQDCERAIHKANPPKASGVRGRGKKGGLPGNAFSGEALRKIRHAHAKVDDESNGSILGRFDELSSAAPAVHHPRCRGKQPKGENQMKNRTVFRDKALLLLLYARFRLPAISRRSQAFRVSMAKR